MRQILDILKRMIDSIILVDEQDVELGVADKMKVHREGLCHRAFSVFIYRMIGKSHIQFLIHQRASCKYHTPHFWTNTCCSHPRPGEALISAGQRRLKEEMGITSKLTWVGKFHYIAKFDNGLIENEVDHVLIGTMEDSTIEPDPNEVQAYRWAGVEEIQSELATQSHLFTPWFNQAMYIALRGIYRS